MFNKVYCAYFDFVPCFYSVEKMDNFHFGLVKFVDSYKNLLKLLLVIQNFVFLKIIAFEYLGEKIQVLVVYLHSYNCVLQSYFL